MEDRTEETAASLSGKITKAGSEASTDEAKRNYRLKERNAIKSENQ